MTGRSCAGITIGEGSIFVALTPRISCFSSNLVPEEGKEEGGVPQRIG